MRRPVLPLDEEVKKEWIDWQQVAQKTALVSGIFTLLLFSFLVVNHINLNADDPLQTTQLIAYKQQLAEDSSNEELKETIRDIDSALRIQLFDRYHKQTVGGRVLAVSLAIFFLSLRIAWMNKPLPPEPGPDPHKAQEHRREMRLGRRAVFALILVMCCFTVVLSATVKRDAPNYVDPDAVEEPSEPVIPTWDALLAQWPSFRGAGANAVVNVPKWAQQWTKETARWHEQISLDGLNSPIIWNNKLFVTGAIEAQRYIYCINIKTGKTAWKYRVKDVPLSPSEHPATEDWTGYAAPTAACDGNNVYAVFANGDMVAVNMDGELQWAMNTGFEGNMYGFSASLAIYDAFVYVQVDQAEGSFMMAIDSLSGKVAWEQDRDYAGSWGSPSLFVDGDTALVVTTGNPDVVAYDAKTGDIKWKHELFSGDVAPTPISANGIIYVCNMACPLAAIKPDGTILWKNEDGSWPDTSSPVTDGEHIWLLDAMGTLTCVQCSDGKKVYEESLEGDFVTSPTIVNNELLMISDKGVVYVVDKSPTFKINRTFESGIPMKASPTFDKSGNMYLRSSKDVYCIGAQ